MKAEFAVIAFNCPHEETKKHGRDRNGNQRFRCKTCGTTFIEERAKPIGDMRIDIDRAVMAINLLLEGMSIRATERITGLHRDTIDDLILVVGENCERFHHDAVVGVPVNDVQIDELWSFVGCKAKTADRKGYKDERGDSWTYIAIERDTKLILAHHVGNRNTMATDRFLKKVRRAVDDTQRYQVTTDGFAAYQYGVPFALGSNIDFGQLIKQYAAQQEETRYSPATIILSEKVPQFGNPDHNRICTSHVERANLTVRMQLRRFTRLTNAHSKSLAHHVAMQAIFFAWYNFCRKHETLKTTPAVASGCAVAPWNLRELLDSAANSDL